MARRHNIQEFCPERHGAPVLAILREIAGIGKLVAGDLDRILRRYPRDGKGWFSKVELIAGYRHLVQSGRLDEDELLLAELRMKPVRTLSGVAPVAVLTEPYPCPGSCVFCPDEPSLPKSYLPREPGAQRALENRFDPYAQTAARLTALERTGHRPAKVELLVLGGTWSAYPESYRVSFVTRCLEALNDHPQMGRAANQAPDGKGRGAGEAAWERLEEAQRRNEGAGARCVGLVLETRPDSITEEEVLALRRLGATRIQLGVQSLSDEILRLNGRGHGVAASRNAFRLLRGAGFKIVAHWMPNLVGSDPARDRLDFSRLFRDVDFRPDELKIYPCSLVEDADLMELYRGGRWRPYELEELVELLVPCVSEIPPYCRVTRLNRDIPGDDIVAGNRHTNLREMVEKELEARGLGCQEIRYRELRGNRFDPAELALQRIRYQTGGGNEVFLQFVTPDKRLAGFLRLFLPAEDCFVPELRGSAIIREVHVYGESMPLGQRGSGRAQHLGLGRRLIEEARSISSHAGFGRLAVISAVGTRPYYRRLGFEDGELYQSVTMG